MCVELCVELDAGVRVINGNRCVCNHIKPCARAKIGKEFDT